MSGSTISTKVTISVTLDTASALYAYPSPLTITAQGDIAPSAVGATGLLAPIVAGYVLNGGAIIGGPGGSSDTGNAGGSGVSLLAGGQLTNQGRIGGGSGSGITGGAGGIGVDLVDGTLTNEGTIAGGGGGAGGAYSAPDGIGGIGVRVTAGTLSNAGWVVGGSGGRGGGGAGIALDAGISLTNHGVIAGGGGGYVEGNGGTGVTLADGSIGNTGTIIGGSGGSAGYGSGAGGGTGVVLGAGTLTNDGSILGGFGGAGGRTYPSGGGGSGVIQTSGNLMNRGRIAGGNAAAGVAFGVGTLTNEGTITGGNGASQFGGMFGDSGGPGVVLSSGTVINHGTIVGGTGFSGSWYSSRGGAAVRFTNGGTLTNTGSLVGGASFGQAGEAIHFGSGEARLILLPEAYLRGSIVADASFGNVIELANGSGPGALAGLGSTVTGFGAVEFALNASWVIEGNTAGLSTGQTITGFTDDDLIKLSGVTSTGVLYSSGVLTITIESGSAELRFTDLPVTFTAANFIVQNVATGVDVSLAPPCFAEGTRILTEHGPIAVETLRIGDRIPVLLEGGFRPIIWIGFRHVECRHHPRPRDVWPIRVRRGAFGPDQPVRDLWLSPDHAVFIADVLIPIRYLVNDRTIRQEPRDKVTYWHVELARHDVLYAEGVPAETYLYTDDRRNFSNGGGLVRLHPDFASRVREAEGCAPLVVTGPTFESVQRSLNEIAGNDQRGAIRSRQRRKQRHTA